MRFYFGLCLTFFICINNLSYGQSYECDNNFGDCGTPDQSGGGGGGGALLIANTDLGDSYQHADDYDDDGIEDPSDNCMRYPNPSQLDRDGDGRGDMCDNCLDDWNPLQENNDADYYGDICDDDIDNDQILNVNDECPYHWGNSSCFNSYSARKTDTSITNKTRQDKDPTSLDSQNFSKISKQSCNQNDNVLNVFYFFIIFSIVSLYKKVKLDWEIDEADGMHTETSNRIGIIKTGNLKGRFCLILSESCFRTNDNLMWFKIYVDNKLLQMYSKNINIL